MSRTLCQHCNRPVKACICRFITKIDNLTPVIILQHPTEVNHSKGTAQLLAKSLQQCHVFVGENFAEHEEFKKRVAQYQPLLLYPGEQAKIITSASEQVKPSEETKGDKKTCLIILDGTWKKAYKMLMLSQNLQALPQVCLPQSLANSGQYLIRKVAKANALSSLEACCYALALLESAPNTQEEAIAFTQYQSLLDKFAEFNQFQLSFRPS